MSPPLSLVTPVGNNFLKNFPDQNAVNCDLIDEYAGQSLVSHALQDWTPVLTASVTNPSLGTGGQLTGKYYRIFDQIWLWAEWRFGSGASIGSGEYRCSLPFRARTTMMSGSVYSSPIPIGTGLLYDLSSDAGRQPLTVNLGGPDFVNFSTRMNTAAPTAFVTHANPVVWSGGVAPGGDGIFWSANYTREL